MENTQKYFYWAYLTDQSHYFERIDATQWTEYVNGTRLFNYELRTYLTDDSLIVYNEDIDTYVMINSSYVMYVSQRIERLNDPDFLFKGKWDLTIQLNKKILSSKSSLFFKIEIIYYI